MFLNSPKFKLVTLAVALSSVGLPPLKARADQHASAEKATALKTFLDRDIARRRAHIETQQAAIAKFREVLESAKRKRTWSIVVNGVQTVGAVFLTKAMLSVFTKKTGIAIAVGAGALVAGEAVYSAVIKFDNVEKIEDSLEMAEKNLAAERADLELLHDSFARLGEDARVQLKSLVQSRHDTLVAAKLTLENYQKELTSAEKNRDVKNKIKIPVYTVSAISAVVAAGSFIAASKARDFGPLIWGVIGTVAAATAGGSYSVMSKVVSVSEADYIAIKKKTDDLLEKIKIEEATQSELVYVLAN